MTDVLKFGGTSVGTAERIRDVARLVAGRGGDPCVVVVSAMGGITDLLVSLKSSSSERDRAQAERAREALAQRHVAALAGLGLPAAELTAMSDALASELRRAEELSAGIFLLEEVSLRTADALLCLGEMISSRLVAAAARAAGADAVWVDPREILAYEGLEIRRERLDASAHAGARHAAVLAEHRDDVGATHTQHRAL
ncbi:MAG TPA: hypothetical protein PLB01_20085, partial [Thermoanaerobaculia bacterium]|nr:hypothetical protein [Thermoanaerobaculia bacterium]